jgi:hypothetical protein
VLLFVWGLTLLRERREKEKEITTLRAEHVEELKILLLAQVSRERELNNSMAPLLAEAASILGTATRQKESQSSERVGELERIVVELRSTLRDFKEQGPG